PEERYKIDQDVIAEGHFKLYKKATLPNGEVILFTDKHDLNSSADNFVTSTYKSLVTGTALILDVAANASAYIIDAAASIGSGFYYACPTGGRGWGTDKTLTEALGRERPDVRPDIFGIPDVLNI